MSRQLQPFMSEEAARLAPQLKRARIRKAKFLAKANGYAAEEASLEKSIAELKAKANAEATAPAAAEGENVANEAGNQA